ncbi:MAG TPA: hypothetical protein VIR32_09990, partial [Lachnospiraceae bacterium]
RNMEYIEYSILDGDSGQVLKVLGRSNEVRKLSRLGFNNSFRLMPDSLWDGKINGEWAQEGKTYIYQLKVKLNNLDIDGAGEQIYKYPVVIDTKAPSIQVENSALESYPERSDGRLKKVKFKVQDSGVDVQRVFVESVQYTKEKLGGNYNITLPGGGNLPPGFTLPDLPLKPKDGKEDKQESRGRAKYLKSLKLIFVDEAERTDVLTKEKEVLPMVVDGKVTIDVSKIPQAEGVGTELYINRNGHHNQEIEVEVPYLTDSPYLQIRAVDYLSNADFKEIETGTKETLHTINFMNYENGLKNNNALVTVNGKLVTEPLYGTLEDTAHVEIRFRKTKQHIATMGVRNGSGTRYEYFLKDDVINEEVAKKYGYRYDTATKTFHFDLSLGVDSVEVVTTVKPGAMPEQVEKKAITLDFSQAETERFSKITLNNKDISQAIKDKKEAVDATSGFTKLEMIFDKEKSSTYQAATGVEIITGDKVEKLRKTGGYFELDEGKKGFYCSDYKLFITAMITDSSIIKVTYGKEEKRLEPKKEIDDDHDHHFDANGNLLDSEQALTDNENANTTKDKYPVIFIQSPQLLGMVTEFNAQGDKTTVKGFVGHLKENDSIESFHIYTVDNQGNPISEGETFTQVDFVADYVVQGEGKKSYYNGIGYKFEAVLDVDGLNLNIKADLKTKNGERASIVRRAFFDKLNPDISYQVSERSTESDLVDIDIKSTDNSLKLELYHNDSLIGQEDKSVVSFEDGGVSVETKLTVNLQPGANEIKLKAVDMTKHTYEKTIFIYRSDKDYLGKLQTLLEELDAKEKESIQKEDAELIENAPMKDGLPSSDLEVEKDNEDLKDKSKDGLIEDKQEFLMENIKEESDRDLPVNDTESIEE